MQIKVVNNSANVQAFIKRVSDRLALSKRQISVESQQLHSVGMMPNPQYRVVEPATLTIAEAVRLIKDVDADVKAGTKYVVVKPMHEGVQDRIDREEVMKSIRHAGGDIIEDEGFLVRDIEKHQPARTSLPISINE